MAKPLKNISVSLLVALLNHAATGQLNTPFPQQFNRELPIQASRPSKIVTGDFTGELMQDVAMLTVSGQVAMMFAPEVFALGELAPWIGWTDIADVPPARPGLPAAVLGVINGSLELVHYSAGAHFTKAPVSVPLGVTQLRRVVTKRVNSTSVLVLAIAADDVTVHVGALDATTFSPLGTIVATEPVIAAAFHEVQFEGIQDVLLRTASGLASYAVDGTPLQTWPVPAGATGGPFASIVRAGTHDRLAWLVHEAAGWRLLVLGRTGQLQDPPLDLPDLGAQFDLIGVGSGDVDADGDFDLVVHQRTPGANGIRQYVLHNGGGPNPFSTTPTATYQFHVPGVSPQDSAPVVVADMNNSGSADSVFATSTGLQLVTGIAHATNALVADDYPDPFTDAFLPETSGALALAFMLDVPSTYAGWTAEIGTMHQSVSSAHSAPHGAYPVDPLTILAYGDSAALITLDTPFATFMGGTTIWHSNHHFYLRIRFVQRTGNQVVASSPTRIVGFVAHTDLESEATVLNYMRSISTPAGNDERRVLIPGRSSSPKQVGHLKAPLPMNIPIVQFPADA